MYEMCENYQQSWAEAWPAPGAFRNRTTSGLTSATADLPANTLKMHFQTLQAKDPGQVLIARKLNQLGFDSPTVLKQHFGRCGTVEDVLVTHSRVRCHSSGSGLRTRPASFGFVVMGSVEEAEMVLAQGSQQIVQGVTICVSPFERRPSRAKSPSEDDQKAGDDEATATGTSSGTSVTGDDETTSDQE